MKLIFSSAVLLSLVVFLNKANAALTFLSATGYSVLETTTENSSYTVYGGFAGTCTAGTDGTCNSCSGATGLTPCNPRNLSPSTNFHIELKTSTANSKMEYISVRSGSIVLNFTKSSIASDGSFSVDILWSEICGQIASSNSSCQTNGSAKTISVGLDPGNDGTLDEKIDFSFNARYVDTAGSEVQTDSCNSDYEGICNFQVARGDEKVYVTNLHCAASYLASDSGSSVKFTKLLLYYVKSTSGGESAAWSTITSALEPKEIEVDSTCNPKDSRITGLINDTEYCFASANQDQALNIFRFAPSYASTMCTTPSKVIGLLDGKHCFIATAAYGSDMAPQVDTFRRFRNVYLLNSKLGRFFVRTYYHYSPPLAGWIEKSEARKFAARLFLWPILFLIQIILHFGFLNSMISLLGSIFISRFIFLKMKGLNSVK